MGFLFGLVLGPAKWSRAKARPLAISSSRDSHEFEDLSSGLTHLRSQSKATQINTQYSPYAFPEGSQVHGLISGHGKQPEARLVRTSR
jgi:hypothetical protein